MVLQMTGGTKEKPKQIQYGSEAPGKESNRFSGTANLLICNEIAIPSRHQSPKDDHGFPNVLEGMAGRNPQFFDLATITAAASKGLYSPDSKAVEIDEQAHAVMMALASSVGTLNPDLVSVPKVRTAINRGQNGVADMVRVWKAGVRALLAEAEEVRNRSGVEPPAAVSPIVSFEGRAVSRGTGARLREAARRAAEASRAPPVTTDYVTRLQPLPLISERRGELNALDEQAFQGFAFTYLWEVRRPALSAEIFDAALANEYLPQFSRKQSREVLREASKLEQLDNGAFWIPGLAVPESYVFPRHYHSRKSTRSTTDAGEPTPQRRNADKAAERRLDFSRFAVALITETGRPAGPAEIYIAGIHRGRSFDFKKEYSAAILTSANPPELRKLPDGRWWHAAREDVPATPKTKYAPRRFGGVDYKALGREVVQIFTARGAPMTAIEIRERLSPDMKDTLSRLRPHFSYFLERAAERFPQICRKGPGLWFLSNLEETRPRHLSIEDECALAAIEVLRLRGHSTSSEIRKLLPRHLRHLAGLDKILSRAADYYPALQVSDGIWHADPTAALFVRRDQKYAV
ncbi:hypothetical protein QY049_20595 [Bradyrhizobium sp. WYCCWR 13022]|uniref:hypothetical protein n=1 Tax=unclassified Bradyrhizobium TaxID=2631580 RepID=UPI00263BA7B4|nr:hypothetical protein [Bradyrhizobium sp. WYCCWR 13022]MDN4985564.1 hypothetical protein [Bradyrhizobium sp. WYCCWR 13022]